MACNYEAASGLKWLNIGEVEPSGQALENEELAAAFACKTCFKKAEWDAFGIKDLHMGHFAKSGDSYFRPAESVEHSLRQWIAGDTQSFLSEVDADLSGDITMDEFLEACSSRARQIAGGHAQVATSVAVTLFQELGPDNNGKISIKTFEEERDAARLYVKEAKIEALIVHLLSGLVHLKRTSCTTAHIPASSEDTSSIADVMRKDLAQLSQRDLQQSLDVLMRSVEVHGAVVQQHIKDRDTGITLSTLSANEAGKFQIPPTAAYGDEESFAKGLEILGAPHSDILGKMKEEMLEGPDSWDKFTAWNSGENITFPIKEYEFVVSPYKEDSVCADVPPSQWLAKFDYGGNRTPIRLEVFMHAMSGRCNKGNKRFGDYKRAHTLKRDDPLWLHADEVSLVKVVLCRFIRSQLDGLSLRNAFKGNKTLKARLPKSQRKRAAWAEKIVNALADALHQRDGSASSCTYEYLVESLRDVVTEEELGALIDHFHGNLRGASIRDAEVIGLRLYTGPSFVKMNSSLRSAAVKDGVCLFPAFMVEHLKGNRYVNLIYACSSALRKISRAGGIPRGRKVFRGMGGVQLPESFTVMEEGKGLGGVDFGYISTTTKREVALAYIAGKARPVLFEIEVGDIDRGCSVSFLSQYPLEEEILLPPLSNIEIVGDPFLIEERKGSVTVFPVRINCNLKSKTIEEIERRRHNELLGVVPYLGSELQRDLRAVGSALVEEAEAIVRQPRNGDMLDPDTMQVMESDAMHAESPENAIKDKVEMLEAQFQRRFAEFLERLGKEEMSQWLNVDENYKSTVGEAIDFRHVCLNELVKKACQEAAQGDDVTDDQSHLHIAAEKGLTKVVTALVEAGASDDVLNADGRSPLMLSLFRAQEAVTAVLLRAVSSGKDAAQILNRRDIFENTALMYAAISGDIAAIKELLKLGARSDLVDGENRTSLMLALKHQHQEASMELLQHTVSACTPATPAADLGSSLLSILGLDLEAEADTENARCASGVDWADSSQRTALMYASEAGMTSAVKEMLQYDALVELKDGDGKTSLMLALEHGHEAVAELLLSPSLKPAEQAASIWTAGLGALTATSLVLDAHNYFDLGDNSSKTALMYAAQSGVTGSVKKLLSHGANPLHKDNAGMTGLSYALESGHDEAAKILLEPVEEPPVVNQEGALSLSFWTAGLVALFVTRAATAGKTASRALDVRDRENKTPLMYAAKGGSTGMIALLLQYGAQVELRETHGRNSLMLAIIGGHEAAAIMLMDPTAQAGAIDSYDRAIFTDKFHWTALMYASHAGTTAVVTELLLKGAKVEIVDETGRNSLMLALIAGHSATAEILVQPTKNADVLNTKDDSGNTALMYARSGSPGTVELLLEHGAQDDSTEQKWLLRWMLVPILRWMLFPILSAVFCLLLVSQTQMALNLVPRVTLSWLSKAAPPVTPVPALPHNLLEAFDIGQIVLQLEQQNAGNHSCSNTTALLDAASVTLGTPVVEPWLRSMRTQLEKSVNQPSLRDGLVTMCTWINVMYIVSMIGISASVGPVMWTVSKRMVGVLSSRLKRIGQRGLSQLKWVVEAIVVPICLQLHHRGVFEAGLYFCAATLIGHGARNAEAHGATGMFFSFLGLTCLQVAALYSTSLHGMPILEAWKRLNCLAYILAWAMLWPALIIGTQAILHRSAAMAYLSTACTIWAFAFNSSMANHCRSNALQLYYSCGACLLITLVSQATGLALTFEIFRSAISVLGALGHYVSLNHLRSRRQIALNHLRSTRQRTHTVASSKVEEAKRQQASAYIPYSGSNTYTFGKCNNEFCRKAKRDHYGPDHRCLDPEEAAAAVREAEGGEIAVQQSDEKFAIAVQQGDQKLAILTAISFIFPWIGGTLLNRPNLCNGASVVCLLFAIEQCFRMLDRSKISLQFAIFGGSIGLYFLALLIDTYYIFFWSIFTMAY